MKTVGRFIKYVCIWKSVLDDSFVTLVWNRWSIITKDIVFLKPNIRHHCVNLSLSYYTSWPTLVIHFDFQSSGHPEPRLGGHHHAHGHDCG